MMTSPAYNSRVVMGFCEEKSGQTFKALYETYLISKTPENKDSLVRAILSLGVVDTHNTRLLHPLALVKSIWDQKPESRDALMNILPTYFMLMADQLGKCANGATGRAILMTRLLADELSKRRLK